MSSDGLTILLFANAREAAGTDRLDLPWSGGDVRALREALTASSATLGAVLAGCAIAVNQQLAHEGTPIAPGDEIAILPPFGGG